MLDARPGAMRYGPVRLPDVPDIDASPVAAADRVYVAGRDGAIVVLKHGPALDVAVNQMDDGFDASPAVGSDELYLRGRKVLYRISK